MIKAVIFDLDNTIYNYDDANRYAELKVAEWVKLHKRIDEKTFINTYNQSKKDIKKLTLGQAASHNRMLYFQRFSEIMGWNPTSCALEIYDVYWDSFLDKMVMFDGIMQMLDFLQEKGIKIAICTELTTHIQHRKIRRLGIGKYIDVLVTSEETGAEKQSPVIFNRVIEKLGISVNEALFVGDNFEKDICGAQNAGIKAVLLDTTDEKHVYETLISIEEYIINQNGQ